MLAERFPVIGGDDDHRAIQQPPLFESLEQAADLRIHEGDLADVGILSVCRSIRLRRIVRPVRIVQMHPQEERRWADRNRASEWHHRQQHPRGAGVRRCLTGRGADAVSCSNPCFKPRRGPKQPTQRMRRCENLVLAASPRASSGCRPGGRRRYRARRDWAAGVRERLVCAGSVSGATVVA